jgi:hypothetical protein
MRMYVKIVSIVALFAVVTACSQVPKEAMDAAMKAREEAIAAEAGVYAKESLAIADTLLDEMNAEIENKSFETAEQLALDAKKSFDEAALRAKKAKDELAAEIPGIVERVSDALQTVEELYAKNKASLKARKIDLNELISELQLLKNALVDAQNDGKSSKLMDEKNKLDGILSNLSAIENMMRKALEK